MIDSKLLEKYDVPCPRYTSYPTVPYWNDSPTEGEWIASLNRAFDKKNASWSLYIHIPFCETLCTYCGCNTIITKAHSREDEYCELLLKEWSNYKEKVPSIKNAPIRQIHLGGGTPTFLSAENLKRVLKPILDEVPKANEHFEASIEVDPRRTRYDQIKALREIGFNRISLGVQDFNFEVQKLVNRIQPFDITKNITDQCRDLGYESINFDLIYGLPRQTMERMKHTVEKTLELRPDRIALYSLAIVPWIKPAQRIFKDEDLPEPADKRALYEYSREELIKNGYIEIGMDHFALPTDSMAKAMETGELHRNFMGYMDFRTDVLLGLGVSSISETPDCFHQNEKVFPVYKKRVNTGEVPTLRGHKLTEDDQFYREQILKFMTQFQVELHNDQQKVDVESFLKELIADELIYFDDLTMKVSEKGKPFLRNACMALDKRLREDKPKSKVFSQSV
ncbi:MAG: oxygen-independent coproporphyrinogen III oxidase [Bdellovibrionales bacterium]|nr:oxygen-independent coproporphyrinogen III oxidase [Bdellovibrionales bacterium]